MKIAPVFGDFIKTYFNTKIGSRVFVGFSCGVPFLLRLTVLDLWLKESGVSNTAIGFFTLLHWPFTLKFLWSPFIEKMDFPFLSKKLGRRRGWALASHILLFLGLTGMALSNPQTSMISLMFFASIVAFADGCQDMALYAYQLDKAEKEMFGPIAGVFVFGYRVGMFFAKSVSLYLAHYLGWNAAYAIMSFSIFLCTIFILCLKEPQILENKETKKSRKNSSVGVVGIIKDTISECLISLFKIFIKQQDCKSVMAVIIFFMAGDRMAQKMAKPFYVDIGFSILEIANVVQVFGTIASLVGGVFGGYVVKLLGVKKAMLSAGVAHAIACFAYIILSEMGHSINMLYFTVFIENTTGGAMSTAFVAFLYTLCNNKKYATTQYALLWAFYELGGMFFRTVSGTAADTLGWTNFFLFVPITFIPSLMILYYMIKIEREKLLKNSA